MTEEGGTSFAVPGLAVNDYATFSVWSKRKAVLCRSQLSLSGPDGQWKPLLCYSSGCQMRISTQSNGPSNAADSAQM